MKDFTQPYKIIYKKFCERIDATGAILPSKAAFARFLGIPPGRMQHWEKGRWPNAADCLLISDRLKINLNWLLNGVGEVDEDVEMLAALNRENIEITEKLDRLKQEISALRSTMKQAMHEIMTLNAENRALNAENRKHRGSKRGLRRATEAVFEQLAESPGVGIPIDPVVAEHMGAFGEHAVTADDIKGSESLEYTEDGYVVYTYKYYSPKY